MFKKILISFLLSLFLLTGVSAKPAYAAIPKWYQSSFWEFYDKVYDPNNPEDIYAERYTAAQVEWVIHGYQSYVLNFIAGIFGADSEFMHCMIVQGAVGCSFDTITSFFDNLKTASLNPSQSSGLAYTNPFQEILSGNRPISGIGYLRGKAEKIRLVPTANAQGFGYSAANPIQGLWRATRDISFFFIILALIVMAFMIMFRIKTSPQTIITIQSALPRLILGIIVITFSYAIAGLLIDLTYVFIGVMSGVLAESGGSGLFAGTWDEMYHDLTGGALPNLGLIYMMVVYFFAYVLAFITGNWLLTTALGPLSLLVFIIVGIAILILYFKIAWMLIKTFVSILLLIAAGPLMILFGSMGGGGAGAWIRALVSHLAVFPTVGLFFALGFYFIAQALPNIPVITNLLTSNLFPFRPISGTASAIANSTWVPPFVPALGGELNMVWLFASYSMISLIPKASDIVKGALAGKGIGYGSAIGAPITGAAGIAGAPFGFVGETWNIKQKAWAESVYSKLFQTTSKIAGKTGR